VQRDEANYPHTFDSKLYYAVTHFGAYVPWILRDPVLLKMCYSLCSEKFGYSQQFYVEPIECLNYDSDIFDEVPDPDLPSDWVQTTFDDI